MNPSLLTSLTLSIGALAFLVWVALVHPAHQNVFGPYAPPPNAISTRA